jgi:hypothetical protein
LLCESPATKSDRPKNIIVVSGNMELNDVVMEIEKRLGELIDNVSNNIDK